MHPVGLDERHGGRDAAEEGLVDRLWLRVGRRLGGNLLRRRLRGGSRGRAGAGCGGRRTTGSGAGAGMPLPCRDGPRRPASPGSDALNASGSRSNSSRHSDGTLDGASRYASSIWAT